MSTTSTIDESSRPDSLRREVAGRFGVETARVRIVRAPYRICPLGAHIDHQRGSVTALAIDRSVLLAYATTEDGRVRLASRDFPGVVEFEVGDVPGPGRDDWGNYPKGAVLALRKRYPIERGIVGLIAGELLGGGVSSSAAAGVAYLLALEEANGLEVGPSENIALDQAIENGYLGLRNGILDQAAILLSKRGFLTRIDCASGEYRRLAAPPGMPPFRILLAYSGLRKSLVGTDYNRRVDECAEAARILLEAVGRPDAEAVLGNVSPEEYATYRGRIAGAPSRRAAHFFGESDRVERGSSAWESGDLETFGRLMTASGASSITHYECGSPPLIDLHEILNATEGVLGARFSGAGFRGCCVALVRPDIADQVAASVAEAYARRQPDLAADAPVVLCGTADAASILEP